MFKTRLAVYALVLVLLVTFMYSATARADQVNKLSGTTIAQSITDFDYLGSATTVTWTYNLYPYSGASTLFTYENAITVAAAICNDLNATSPTTTRVYTPSNPGVSYGTFILFTGTVDIGG